MVGRVRTGLLALVLLVVGAACGPAPQPGALTVGPEASVTVPGPPPPAPPSLPGPPDPGSDAWPDVAALASSDVSAADVLGLGRWSCEEVANRAAGAMRRLGREDDAAAAARCYVLDASPVGDALRTETPGPWQAGVLYLPAGTTDDDLAALPLAQLLERGAVLLAVDLGPDAPAAVDAGEPVLEVEGVPVVLAQGPGGARAAIWLVDAAVGPRVTLLTARSDAEVADLLARVEAGTPISFCPDARRGPSEPPDLCALGEPSMVPSDAPHVPVVPPTSPPDDAVTGEGLQTVRIGRAVFDAPAGWDLIDLRAAPSCRMVEGPPAIFLGRWQAFHPLCAPTGASPLWVQAVVASEQGSARPPAALVEFGASRDFDIEEWFPAGEPVAGAPRLFRIDELDLELAISDGGNPLLVEVVLDSVRLAGETDLGPFAAPPRRVVEAVRRRPPAGWCGWRVFAPSAPFGRRGGQGWRSPAPPVQQPRLRAGPRWLALGASGRMTVGGRGAADAGTRGTPGRCGRGGS